MLCSIVPQCEKIMTMKAIKGKLNGIILIEPDVYPNNRGFFLESYNKKTYEQIGINHKFVQDNHSASTKGTLRGMHWQVNYAVQAKLVRVIFGKVLDVVVDIRKSSPTFGLWEGFQLSAENKKQLFVPVGFAHSYFVISDYAEFLYKCDNYYSPKDERGFIWNDPDIGIKWPENNPVLSEKDLKLPSFKDIPEKDLF